MTFSGLVTRFVTTPNQDPRTGGAKPKYIVHHHEAGTYFEAVLRSWHSGAKQGSCHVSISNSGEAVGVVPEQLLAWSLSSNSFDSMALTTEIENSMAGGAWPVSHDAHEKAAQLTADWCKRYNIPCDREHVIGHREVYTKFGKGYATACPGGLDLNWIVARANEILGAGSHPAPVAAPIVAVPASVPFHKDWEFWVPNKALQLRIQQALAARGRYAGLKDGDWGKLSIMGIQLTIRNVGYTGEIDGIPGPMTCFYVQVYAKRFGDYPLAPDQLLGPNSWANFALGLERP